MFGYYLGLAFRSLRRNVVLTALMIAAVGVGIGASMTTLTIFRSAAGDPIPQRSAQLFAVQIDNCGPGCRPLPPATPDRIAAFMTYIDATELMRGHAAKRQAAMYATSVTVTPPNAQTYPFQVAARATFSDFFPMFDVPFEYGGPWSGTEDEAHSAVVVITRTMNNRLFGGENSVGRTLRLDTEEYRVLGVLDEWQPIPRFYDPFPGQLGNNDEVFIPFTHAIDRQFAGRVTCNKKGPAGAARQQLLASECVWLQFWVELPTAAAVRRYRETLTAYAAAQRDSGRFQWPPRVQLRDVRQWLRDLNVVPAEVRIAVIVSLSLLLACLLNAMGLILAKFLARTADISVRRAAGANRSAIFVQSLVEIGIIGVLGAAFGLLLMAFGLRESRTLLPANLLELTHVHVADVLIALALAITTTLLAGLYPIWRTSRVQPALQLKVQ